MTTLDLPLAADFASADYDDWRKLVDGVLKGAPFEKLVGKTSDGLPIEPIYRRAADSAPVAGRPAAAPWQIMQRIDHPDAGAANAQALQDLENGATGLTLVFSGAGSARRLRAGVDARSHREKYSTAFLSTRASLLNFRWARPSRMAATHVAKYIKSKGIKPEVCDIRFGRESDWRVRGVGIKPLCMARICARSRRIHQEPRRDGIQRSIRGCRWPRDPWRRRIGSAGTGIVLATGVAYLRALESAGVDLDEARNMIYACLAADADQFSRWQNSARCGCYGRALKRLAALRPNRSSSPPRRRGGC